MSGKLIIGGTEIELDIPSPHFMEYLLKNEEHAAALAASIRRHCQKTIKRAEANADPELVSVFERAFLRDWANEEGDAIEAQLERAAKDLRAEAELEQAAPKPAL